MFDSIISKHRSVHGTVAKVGKGSFVVKVPQPVQRLTAEGTWEDDPDRVYAFKWVKCECERPVEVGDKVIARTHPERRSVKDENGRELGGFTQKVDALTILS